MMAYLSSTPFIDYEHEEIERIYRELGTVGSEREYAAAAFRFARDAVWFQFCSFEQPASVTALTGSGHCYHKANLFAALCRRRGIEAGLKYCELKPETLEPYMEPEVLDMLRAGPIGHFYAAAKLDGEWVSFDPIFDLELLRLADRLHWRIAGEWDGDGEMKLPEELILSDNPDTLPAAFPEGALPPTPPEMLDKMNGRLRVLRDEAEAS